MDIVEWLRERAKSFYNPMQSKLLEAADEIERLRNKVKWLEMCENTVIKQDNEIERLRNVLKRIVDIDWQFENSGTLERIEGRCAVIARTALKEGE
jgi:hypothetical protein